MTRLVLCVVGVAAVFVAAQVSRVGGVEPKADLTPSRGIASVQGIVAPVILRACAKLEAEYKVQCTDERVRDGKISISEFQDAFGVLFLFNNSRHHIDAFETILVHKSELNMPNILSSPDPRRS